MAPLMSFAEAIAAAKPDLVLPCDDTATVQLHGLYHRELRRGIAGAPTCSLIERSLGAPASFPVVYARTNFMELAQGESIRVPKSEVVTNTDALRRWIARMGLPIVLKADCTSGGDGVWIAHTLEEAGRALRALEAPPLLARAAKRALIDRDMTLVWPSLLRRRYVVNAQEFVAGREATSAIACWKGTVLAGLHFEVLKKQDAGGPATVLRLIENAEMSTAAEKMARRLELSGLHGFDYMLEGQTGKAYLIEINPRATQVGHLMLGLGRDLPAALYAALTGEVVRTARKVTENTTIALFPQEWMRNPASAFLRSAYHDVPWEEPELVRFSIRERGNQTSWYLQHRWIQALLRVRRPRP
jgi:acetyl/propionyl-CoA carboxylase alpha subunit